MAFYSDYDEENQQNQSGSNQPNTTGQSGIISGQSGNAQQPVNTSTPDKPNNFVGIQQYLDANKSQGGKLGSQVAGVIDNSANTANEGINNLSQTADNTIKSTSSLSPDLQNKIKTSPQSLTDEEKNTIKNTQSAKYTGPSDVTQINGYSDVASNVQKAQQNVDNSSTEQGRMGLIKQVNSKPRTLGMDILDNALVQSGDGRNKIAESAKQNKGITDLLTNAFSSINSKIGRTDDPSTLDIDESSGAIGQTNKASNEAKTLVGNTFKDWTTTFNSNFDKADDPIIQQQTDLKNSIGDLINSGYKLPQNVLDALGLTVGTSLYDTNLNNYLTNWSSSDITKANFATPEDYAQYAALADLAGDTSGMLNPNDISKAGTMPTKLVDKEKLQADIKAKEDAYQKSYNTERNGVLNIGYLGNPGIDWNTQIPGALTDRRDLSSATPAELESYWLPLFTQADQSAAAHGQANGGGENLLRPGQGNSGYSKTANAIIKSLQDWKANNYHNRQIGVK